MSAILKRCTRCQVAKLLDEFHRSNRTKGMRPARQGYGVASQCKACRSEINGPLVQARRKAKAELVAKQLKLCGICKTALPHSAFTKRAASVDKLAYKCKTCSNENNVKWREDNPGGFNRWFEKNKEHKLAYGMQWRAENAEHLKERFAKWAKANPHKVTALSVKRRAAKLNATVAWADKKAIEAIYAESVRLTRETGIRHNVDHIVPLQGRTVSGLHWEGNLQILTRTENISKFNRYWPDAPT